MVQLISTGHYELIETKNQTKILSLDGNKMFAWVNAHGIGEILVATHKHFERESTLAVGKYRLYSVTAEPELTDVLHIELFVGEGVWQGYLLPTGLPTSIKTRNRIIPTHELVTR